MLEKTILKDIIPKIPKVIMHIVTFILIMIGWTIFRADNLEQYLLIIQNIFTGAGTISINDFILSNSNIVPAIPYFILAIIFSTNVYKIINDKLEKNIIYYSIKKIILIVLLLICIMFLVSSSYNPFIYFRF